MKTKLIIGALVLIIGFTGCASSYYVTSPGSPGRHQGYKRGDDYRDGYDRFHRGHWHYRDGYRGNRGWRYRRW